MEGKDVGARVEVMDPGRCPAQPARDAVAVPPQGDEVAVQAQDADELVALVPIEGHRVAEPLALQELHLPFLRSTYREDGKVKHRTLGNLSDLAPAVIDGLRRLLKGAEVLTDGEGIRVLRSRPHGHVAAVLGTLRKLGLDKMLDPRATRVRALCVAMVVARIIEPRSKLATARGLQTTTLRRTLDEIAAHVGRHVLGVADVAAAVA